MEWSNKLFGGVLPKGIPLRFGYRSVLGFVG